MQSFNGYNPNDAAAAGSTGSMPPPTNMTGMNLGSARPNHQQQYQPHMRSNNLHHHPPPPSSPGYAQSPPNFNNNNTPTPPGSVGPQFYGQPLLSPTKASPTSQPQMAAGSPQASSNPTQQSQKQMNTGQGDVSKIDAARIDLLLELNKVLLQEVLQLQLNGRAGPAVKQNSDGQTGQQSPVTKDASEADGEKKAEDATKKGPPPSREYIECMLRLRGNIAWLTSLASRNTPKPQPIVDRPQIMEPLSANIEGNTISEESMNTIREMYKRMKELFPPTAQQQSGQAQNQSQQQAMQPQQMQLQQQQQQQQNMTAHQQAQNMQQQLLMHQQQMAAQVGNMQGMSPAGMGRGQAMNPQLMQQQMMARAMAGMQQNQQNNFGQGM